MFCGTWFNERLVDCVCFTFSTPLQLPVLRTVSFFLYAVSERKQAWKQCVQLDATVETVANQHTTKSKWKKPMIPSVEDPLTDSFEDKFVGLSALKLIRWSVDEFGDDLIVSTSFGIQSVTTLKLATMIKPDIKVVWIDTGYLPKETVAYAKTLTDFLDLNLHVYKAEQSPEEMEAKYGKLWESDRVCLLYTSPSPRDQRGSRMPSSA